MIIALLGRRSGVGVSRLPKTPGNIDPPENSGAEKVRHRWWPLAGGHRLVAIGWWPLAGGRWSGSVVGSPSVAARDRRTLIIAGGVPSKFWMDNAPSTFHRRSHIVEMAALDRKRLDLTSG
ncbi:hypothetical protein [Frankia sp. QA3]|uniref:hypothetical protein n=1 Tax=Frankia sp. QA3 TaxID=710111 RepID=UPI0012F91EFA|nr:hypothetical protein [Frankia sp. QA3]